MKIEKNNSNKLSKKAVIIAAVVLTLAIGGAAAAYQFGAFKKPADKTTDAPAATNQVDYGPATDEQKAEDTPTPTPGVSSVSITNAAQEGTSLRIRTTVSSEAAGNCKLSLSMAGQTDITRQADTQDMGSYSTCKGFDIDTNSMAKGTWKVSIAFSGDSQGAVATTNVEVR